MKCLLESKDIRAVVLANGYCIFIEKEELKKKTPEGSFLWYLHDRMHMKRNETQEVLHHHFKDSISDNFDVSECPFELLFHFSF